MLALSAKEVEEALPMEAAIAAMKRAYQSLSTGRAQVPLRARLPVGSQEGVCLFMPAYLADPGGEALAVKVVSVFPNNPARDLPIIHAAVLVLDAETGQPTALLEGGSLTAIRTGAGSGAATDVLAREDSRVGAVFGAGVQGRTQLQAICTVRQLQTIWLYDPSIEKAEVMASALSGREPIPRDVRVTGHPEEAARDADVICTATTSRTPVFEDTWLKPGVHINGIGSYTPEMREVPADTVARAQVVVDSREGALAESGDLIQPIEAGRFSADHIQAELGEILAGQARGRERDDGITFFKSVGVAVQDAAAAQEAIRNARALGLGQELSL